MPPFPLDEFLFQISPKVRQAEKQRWRGASNPTPCFKNNNNERRDF
jgi:hypothetical protein